MCQVSQFCFKKLDWWVRRINSRVDGSGGVTLGSPGASALVRSLTVKRREDGGRRNEITWKRQSFL